MEITLIAILGVVGVFLRYGMDTLLKEYSVSFPLGTLVVNLLGAFLAGVIYVMGPERGLFPEWVKTGLLVGLCGGFTTFSAYVLQSFLLLEERKPAVALLYLFSSPVLGLLFIYAGVLIARTWVSR